MLRSRSLLCADDTASTPSTRSHYLVMIAALGMLITSPLSASGQTDEQPDSSRQANPQSQICDGIKQSDPHHLSLSIAKQQSTSQDSSDLIGQDVKLPQITSSSRMPQEEVLLCKKKKTEPVTSDDPSPQTTESTKPAINPTAATVSYSAGKLTIDAENVPLRDVLEAIQARAGITVELPSEGMDNSVFDHVGPAPVPDALAQLLYGSGYNYVIQTSAQNPQIVTKLVLSAQTRVAAASPPQHAGPPKNEQADNQALYGEPGFNTPVAIEPMPPVPVANPLIGIPAGFNVQQAATASGKTPGQILDELQKQQMQVLDDQSPPK